MPDPYASISQADESLQSRLAEVLELRAADDLQREMLNSYLAELDPPKGSAVLEVGCGTGPVSRVLANIPSIETVVGLDPSSMFVEKARTLSKGVPGLSFDVGDGRSMDFGDGAFDVVVFHTTLCHIPGPEKALAEAYRVLKPGGRMAVFDGDYMTTTVAISESDPLQTAVELMVRNFVENPWLSRRLPRSLRALGLTVESFRSHGYTKVEDASYMQTLVERGADLMASFGTISEEAASALKQEAQRRIENGEFFGHISFISAIARRSVGL